MDGAGPAEVAARPSVPAGGRGSRLINRYMLRLLAQPLMATLLVVLPALLLERLLRLFDLVANGGGGVAPIVRLVLYLAPHYVGLALPAAFFISVFTVMSRLAEHHELDALQGTGISLARLSRPFLYVGAVLTLAGLGLFGYLQPLGRYQYRAAFHAVTHAGWNATVAPGEFIRIGGHLSVMADDVDRQTGELTGVFIQQRQPDGTEITTTARAGWLTPQLDAGRLHLELEGGTQIAVSPDGTVRTLDFGTSAVSRPFSLDVGPFRPRGDDEREMTLDELWNNRPAPPGTAEAVPHRRIEGELHGRLVRSFSMVLLPLLAIPMALGAKRTRRWHGAVLSALIMVLYHHAVQLAESLGDIGLADPRPLLWGIFTAFAAFCLISFRQGQRNPYEGPFDALFGMMERFSAAVAARLPRRRRRPS
ncbi:MAG: hypothetical protein JWP20_916 [Roseomonas sp.]|nr:hypothetical protein [Roseomonas sp.]